MSVLDDPEIVERLQPKEFYQHWMNQNFPKRPDGRTIEEFRPIQITKDSIKSADSSAIVRLGPTTVVTGIKAEVTEPSVNHPNCGFFVFNATLAAGCCPQVRSGPPTEKAQLITNLISDLFTKTCLVDQNDLVIDSGKLVWCLHVDTIVICDSGNIFDAIWVSIISAVLQLQLPQVFINEVSGIITADCSVNHRIKIKTPLPTSYMYLSEQKIIMDPNSTEEALLVDSGFTLYDSENLSPIYTHTLSSTNTGISPPELSPSVENHLLLIKSLII